jgi:outer membrane protein TolC
MTFRERTMMSLGRSLVMLAALMCVALSALPGWSEPPAELPEPRPRLTLSCSGAVQWALRSNPQLATFRRNRGIAEAGVVIARQYPFNPIIQDFVMGAGGPSSAGITNRVFNEHTMRLDLEWNHQGRYRRGMARAALTRTEWEIAAQELLLSIQVSRAFNTLLYRQGKYRMLEETEQLTQQVAGFIEKLVEQGKQGSADLLLARADIVEARTALGPARSLLVVASNDLRRALGMIGEDFEIDGTLERGYVPPEAPALVKEALARRPDLHAFEFAVQEADNRLKLEVANRWGNPSLGPATEFNETSVYFIGSWLIWQAPIINQRRGEIRQREAERARAIQAVQQSEIQIQQDVFIALARLAQAQQAVNLFGSQTLPELRKAREAIDTLFAQGQPGVDLARVIDIRRRILRARDAYLDALWEQSQAQVDLAAAVADLSLADCSPAPEKNELTTEAQRHREEK